ncbi:MAG: M20/M25/M40 family metallo-hydrolase, partial [Candidatus Omnitrophica bacterium]|nr:M20/M25/M40 family metallo-hydrolase [Candidatus Omnitrophota bacterium]
MDRSTVRPIAMIAALILIGVLLGAQLYTMKPPPPREIGSPDRLFSAERAKATLDELLAEEAPHPAGTKANIQVRSRIAEKLESYGYEVEKQDAVYYAENRAAFYSLQNLMAKLPGREDGPAVAVVAHHDSVGAGPGASDDMANVAAILEIARMLKQEEPFRNPILFLITDGEEHWLLGAKSFMEEHPWAKEIGAVINLEARGTAGRSIMFETSDKNSLLIDAYTRSVRSPEAASISYEIYKRMPNDTDFTVFKNAGIPGMNFAFIQNKELYHTALDNRENMSLGSLQHQGESVFNVVKKLANMDLNFPSLENRVYQSLFGVWFVSWPESWNIWGLWIDFALLMFVLFVLMKYKYLDKKMLGWGVLAWAVVVVVTVFGASSLMKGLSALSGVAEPWYAFPLASRIALAGSVLFLGWILGLYYAKKAGFWGLLMGNLFWWTIAAIALVYSAPLASYVALGPLDAAAYLLFVICFTPLKKYFFFRELAALIPALVTAFLWIGMAVAMDLAFGLAKSEWIAFPIALILTSLLPLCAVDKARRKSHKILLTLTLLVVIGSSAAALYFPPFSETAPQRI